MKTTKILRHKILEPSLNGKPLSKATGYDVKQAQQNGTGIKPRLRQTIDLPAGSSVLYAEASSKGGINLWTIGGDPETTEKRSYAIVRTGEELPAEIMDCRHIGTYGGAHLFEIPGHLVKLFKAGTKAS